MNFEDLRLKENQMIFFVDYNNTLVDYENEFDSCLRGSSDERMSSNATTRFYLLKTLKEFEVATGIAPQICIVTNASRIKIDSNGYEGIFNDIKNTFFVGEKANELKKYIKYLVCKENDCFYQIQSGKDYNNLFEKIDFSQEQKFIRYAPDFRKYESVSRMLSILDPGLSKGAGVSKYILFAGDSIKDDYPMMKFETPEGVSKVFVRPGKVKKMSENMMWKFYLATGGKMTSVNPRRNRPYEKIDTNNFHMLNVVDQNNIKGYSLGGKVFLTQKNSRGLMDGIRELQKLIVQKNANQSTFGSE